MLHVTARAKINWTLDITGRREDGYHLMDMLLSSVTLADELTLEAADELTLTVLPQGSVAAEDNLALRAARALREQTGCTQGAHVTLQKHIPVGAGMGGGSADAAGVLRGLCALWGLDVPEQQMLAIGLKLGADVPFQLTGGVCRVQGIGEMLHPLPCAVSPWLVGVQPCGGLSTKEIFTAFDGQRIVDGRPDNAAAETALRRGDLAALCNAMGNVMQPISVAREPEMALALARLKELGALKAMMTGSGSVVYGVFAQEETAKTACEALRRRWSTVFLTRLAECGVVVRWS